MAKKTNTNDEDGVWRTIGGRKVFIRNGQSLSDAMKESGKFKSAKASKDEPKETEKVEKEEPKKDEIDTRYDDNYRGNDYWDLSDAYESGDYDDDNLAQELKKMYKTEDGAKKAYKEITGKDMGEEPKHLKDVHDDTKPSKEENIERQRLISEYRQNASKEDYLKLMDDTMDHDVSNDEIKERIKGAKINNTMDRRAEIIDKLDDDTKDLGEYDKYNLAVSKLENTEGMKPTERQYWAGIKERYEKDQSNLRDTEKEYGELNKKMQGDDYYYKPEDDRKLKDLRAKADSERARLDIDSQEKYDKMMEGERSKVTSEDLNGNVNFSIEGKGGKKEYVSAYWSSNDIDEEDIPDGANIDDWAGIGYDIYDEDGEMIDGGMLVTDKEEFDADELCKDLIELNGYDRDRKVSRLDDGDIDEIIENDKSNVSDTKADPYDDPESEESQRLQSVQSRYDDYLQKTEGRGASYGEISYVDNLRGKELDDFEKELDDFEEKQANEKPKSTNETMNEKIREKAKKKTKVEPNLPKKTEIKEQGTSNRKAVSENIQAHILEYYDDPQDFVEQMEYMNEPNMWRAGEELASGGSYAIYYEDQRDFLDSLKINPKGKEFSDDKVFDTYKSLIGRESAKLYDRLKRNSFDEYKREHPLSKMTFEEFKNQK